MALKLVPLMNDELKDFLINLAEKYTSFGKSVCIDGVISLENSNDDSEKLVLNVHYKTTPTQPSVSHPSHKEPFQVPHRAYNDQHRPATISISEDEHLRDLVTDEFQRTETSADQSSNETLPQEYPAFEREPETLPSTTFRNRRKGNPKKHIQYATDSDDDESYLEPTNEPLHVETMNPASSTSPTQSVSMEKEPLLKNFNSDDVASSSARRYNHDFELQAHPLENVVTEPKHNMSLTAAVDWYAASPSCETQALPYLCANNTIKDSAASSSLNPLPPSEDHAHDYKYFTCSLNSCMLQLLGSKSFETHSTKQHNRFPCHLCKKTFSTKHNRTRHTQNHNHDKLHPCPDCNKKFSRSDSIREHRLTHTLSYKEGKCRCCGEKIHKKSELLVHLKDCFRSYRKKDGSVDESRFDNRNTINGNSMEDTPSGLWFGMIKRKDNNEPMHTFHALPEQSLHDLDNPKETVHMAVEAITQAHVHTPPAAHMH